MAEKATGKEAKTKVEVPPDQTPLERMTELARRILGVPKAEAIPPKKPHRKRP